MIRFVVGMWRWSGFPDLRPERQTLRLMLSLELGEELHQSLHTLLGMAL